jgi:hypothetical protein
MRRALEGKSDAMATFELVMKQWVWLGLHDAAGRCPGAKPSLRLPLAPPLSSCTLHNADHTTELLAA